MKFTHVRLLVTDFPAAFRFYRDVLALRPTFGTECGGYAEFAAEGDDTELALFDRSAMLEAVGAGEPLAVNGERLVLAFQVSDVDSVLAALWERGAFVVREPIDRPEWGIRTAHVRDPEGNLVEIFQPLPREVSTSDLPEAAESSV